MNFQRIRNVLSEALHIAVEQFSPHAGPDRDAIGKNRLRMEEAVASSPDADLVVFPELSLTGYAAREDAQSLALPLTPPPLSLPSGGPTAAFGFIERGSDQLIYNSALVLEGREILASHRKVYLPTYGIFDEGRTFARGRRPLRPFLLHGWSAGLLVCEDLWHPALPYLLALQRIDLLIVLAAAPGRGESTDPERFPLFGSGAGWELVICATALLHGVYVVVANRTGDEGGHTFAGGSLVADPLGSVVARAPQGEEASLMLALKKAVVREARSEFSHLRDEDPEVTYRQLGRILSSRDGD